MKDLNFEVIKQWVIDEKLSEGELGHKLREYFWSIYKDNNPSS